MGNSKSTAISPEAERIMIEVLTGKSTIGDVPRCSRKLKRLSLEKTKKKRPEQDRNNEIPLISPSVLVQAYSHTRTAKASASGGKRSASVKECAETLASRRVQEMRRTQSAPIESWGRGKVAKLGNLRTDTLGPAKLVLTCDCRVSQAA